MNIYSLGKTYTMEGTESERGIVPRTMEMLFSLGKEMTTQYQIHMSHFEIYNEKVFDLLVPVQDVKDLPIRQDVHGDIVVSGLSQVRITEIEAFNKLYAKGCLNRKKGSTKLNSHSSRSHSILMFRIQANTKGGVGHIVSKLHLIDLAGSEDNRKTGNSGLRLTESAKINQSLFVLGNVINALNEKKSTRIPYRDSKLTRLLQDSLGGSSHAVMICNVAPCSEMFYENYQTLNYAAKARQIVNLLPDNDISSHIAESMEDKLAKWKSANGKSVKENVSGTRKSLGNSVQKRRLSSATPRPGSTIKTVKNDRRLTSSIVPEHNKTQKRLRLSCESTEDDHNNTVEFKRRKYDNYSNIDTNFERFVV